MERFYETLFEVSNDYRYNILTLLKNEPLRTTNLSKKLQVTTQEISRHAARLSESELIYKDVEGYYILSNYGTLILSLLEEFQFVAKHRKYFASHTTSTINPRFIKIIGSLSKSILINDTLEFLHYIDKLIKESNEEVWLLVDRYPLTFLGSIIEGINRGVKFRIAELDEISSGPHMNLKSIEDEKTIEAARNASQSKRKTLSHVGVFMFISERNCAIAFPTKEEDFDYKGFVAQDQDSINWCKELFLDYWNKQDSNVQRPDQKKAENITPINHPQNGIAIVTGNDSILDAQQVQKAVDNYQEVLLKGSFNFGESTINIRKDVKIKGEIKNGQPVTRIYKRGWSFPFTQFESVFKINDPNSEVTIENIHFTDFNCTCIDARRAKRLKILNNKITLETGHGRGWTYQNHGDIVCGIWIENNVTTQKTDNNFSEGIVIEGNTIDFSDTPLTFSPNMITERVQRSNQLLNPSTHEHYMGIGINVFNISSKLEITNNTIRNMNARGISISDTIAKTLVRIDENVITSNIPGTYPFRGSEAGVGIFIHNSFKNPPIGSIMVNENTIKIETPDYCGIMINESPKTDISASSFRLEITDNKIHLREGQASIKTDSHKLDVSNNILSGNSFFGILLANPEVSEKHNTEVTKELLEKNDSKNLKLIDSWFWVSRNEPTK